MEIKAVYLLSEHSRLNTMKKNIPLFTVDTAIIRNLSAPFRNNTSRHIADEVI